MVIVIISGHIDLSVGSIAGFVGAMSAVLMIRQDMPWPVAVGLCLLLGALIGAWQGFWIAYVGIPSFIVTLAGMLVFRGATQYLVEGQSDRPVPPQLQPGQQRVPARGRRQQPVSLAHDDPGRAGDGRRGMAAGPRSPTPRPVMGSTSCPSDGSPSNAPPSLPPWPRSRCCWRATAGCRWSASSWRWRSSSTHS